MANAETIERLRSYLRGLSPSARALLIGELEHSVLRSEEVAGADLVLHQLRTIVREQHEAVPRIDNATRLVFKPLEPFLVDDRADHRHPGRIARCSLESLWTWIRRYLLPEETKTLTDEIGSALLAGNEPKAEHLARAFQDRVAVAIAACFEQISSNEKSYRRVLAQIGTPRASEDATTLKCVFKGRDQLAKLAGHLPLRIGNLADGLLDECRALIDGAAARDGDLVLYGLLAVMNRLAAPWQLIRLGIAAAGSDTAARVAEHRYGVAVTIVIAELERMVGELHADLHSGHGVAVCALLKTIHDSARALRSELKLPVDSTWGRALAAQRGQIADLLRSEIESMPGRVSRLLRPRPSTEIVPNSVLDPDDVKETEALIEFAGTCRNFASELAINEITQRTYSGLQHYLDSGTRALLEGLRHAGTLDRSFRQSQVDAAVRFCAKVFGRDYASQLCKAAELAGGPERKVA